jgi:hypothetical protein
MAQGSFVMNVSTKFIAGAAALTGVLAMADPGAVQGEDLSPGGTLMRPLYAVSFDIGRWHVLSYFLRKNARCNLTVMATERPDETPEGDFIPTLSTAQFKRAIHGGKTAWLDTAQGKVLEYFCSPGAHWMKVREVNQFARTSPRLQHRIKEATMTMAGLGD